MPTLRIDAGWLLEAMSSGDGTMSWYLDRQTGEVVMYDEDLDFGLDDVDEGDGDFEEDESAEDAGERPEEPFGGRESFESLEEYGRAVRRAIRRGSDRFLPVPAQPSYEAYREMERFASSLPSGRARDALFDALDRRRPFRAFKDTLAGLGELRDQWFKYEEEQARQRMLEWLESEGIEAELY